MKNRHKVHRTPIRLLAAAALMAVLLTLSPDGAAGAAGPDYIVKYKASCAWLMEDGAPFEVVSETEMKRLRALGVLEWYEPDGEAILMDDLFDADLQWNLGLINAQAAFERGCLGRGVRVGVLDSGVNPHPDFENRLLAGRNYINDARDPDNTADSYGHGTRVAGMIAAVGETGYVGVAPGAELVPLKVTDGKSVKISAVCRAIYGGIDDYGCRVLNMSLGVQTQYEALKEAVDYAEDRGVVIVSAAGNGGTAALFYPAAYDSVIGVGAVDRRGEIYARSNRNESVWITAPGVEVRTTAAFGGYTTGTGTSFAVPQASGAAAVLLGVEPTASPAEIRALLAQSAADRGAAGYDTVYGYGILDLGRALDALGGRAAGWGMRFTPETGPADGLLNETDEPVSCTYALAYYDGSGVCRSVQTWEFTVPAHGSTAIQAPDGTGSFGQFVYETDTMTPLAKERKGP